MALADKARGMSALKVGPANQHVLLHGRYGHDDCCLCRVEAENGELRAYIAELEQKLGRPLAPTVPPTSTTERSARLQEDIS